MTTTKHHTEEDATGFLVWADGLTLERDTAQTEAAELRTEVKRLKADNSRNRALAAGYRNECADLHNVIAGLRGQLGIRP